MSRPAQIALAWVLAKRPACVPIPGTTKVERLKENLAAVDIQLAAADLRRIEEGTSKIRIQGARLPAQK